MICFGCVENLRAKNIFRADKGVKCPFCRQYVTQYEPCNRFMLERNQPFLQRCYSEAGLGFSQGRIVTDGDTPQRVLNAFKQRGEERLMRLVKVLARPEVFLEVATHFLGSYGLQTLVEATLVIRQAMERAAAQGQAALTWFRSAHEGRDPHGVLLYAALPNAVDISRHEQATYLVQKLADHAEPQELVDLCGAIFPQGPDLVLDHKGVYVMNKLLSMLKTVCCGGVHRFDACELADGLCWHFMEAPDKLKFCLHNTLASKPPYGTLPSTPYGALRLGSQVASSAMRLMSSKNGPACVLSMLEMESVDAMCNELVRDLICSIAMKLQGSLYGLLMRTTCVDDRAPQVVRKLIQRLAAEHEEDWLDAFCQELINYGDVISESPEALEVLQDALCFNVQGDESVVEHITQLRQIVPSQATMRAIEEDICNRRDSNPDPPPPRYHAPSFITPILKYALAMSEMPLEPPPPPPKAGRTAGGSGNGGAYAGYGSAGIRNGGHGSRTGATQGNNVNAAFDESFFAEGLFDPAAPVQATTADGGLDGWGTSSGDPWANTSTGEDWLAGAGGSAQDIRAAPPPAAAAPTPATAAVAPAAPSQVAAAVAPTASAAPQSTGQMLLQSLQRPVPTAQAANGVFAAPSTATTSVAAQQATTQLRPIASVPSAAVAPVAAGIARPVAHPAVPPSSAVNPTLAAARAVAHAAMQAQQKAQQQAAQQGQHPAHQQQQQQPAAPAAQPPPPHHVQYHHPQFHQPPPQAEVPIELQPAVAEQGQPHQIPEEQRRQLQQHGMTNPPIGGTGAFLAHSALNGVGMATAASAVYATAVPYMPVPTTVAAAQAAQRPRMPAIPYPMALLNPALAVLNNTAGIAAFAPRANNALVLRPTAVPVVQVPVTAQVPQAPSAGVIAAAPATPYSAGAASAATAATAAAGRQTVTTAPAALHVSHPHPPPSDAAASRPQILAPAPLAAGRGTASTTADVLASWQCQICTYNHKGAEAHFLACAICGCERGLQQLPP
ncbi:hypothetical protein VOLCADRAFT_103016 [Volvox carteri f. nagariensis]|uniref:Uncharacterized protein n=1 Tax=Volvox carteri f. nagariensis TaxID=3068 RepID=D8TJC7_VOLCA|nr:uncharacterized protein VOLCADRAFT_103016 [Volvox carteri f. nagariensis]EFJ52520.1 hypothetical protein VOLCADRAFT_103016 [Volvox carteri f. nagariensis]|eukprot:XP_002946593.1 hypothetical protein VOLCADRAFT_103016 [Volvox carteri f. nagariensis]